MGTKVIEEKVKLILEKTTPQAFLLWLFIFLIDIQDNVFFGFRIDKNLLSFLVLICIGLAFSSIIGKLKKTEVALEACQKANLVLRYKKGIPIDAPEDEILLKKVIKYDDYFEKEPVKTSIEDKTPNTILTQEENEEKEPL